MYSEGHRSPFHFGRCKTSATGTLQPSVEGLTAYRYGSTHVLIITIKNYGCNKKMAEEVVGVGDKAFRTRLPVPRNQANKNRACKSAIFHCVLDRKTVAGRVS